MARRQASLRAALAGGALAILLSGCATGVSDRAASCDAAVAQAMAVDPRSDTVGAIDGAMASCPSLEAWVTAATRYPDTTAGRDPVTYAEARCAGSTQLAGAALCVAIGAQ